MKIKANIENKKSSMLFLISKYKIIIHYKKHIVIYYFFLVSFQL